MLSVSWRVFPLLGSSNYTSDNLHSAVTSSQVSVCSVEPANAEDVSAIVSRSYPFILYSKLSFIVKTCWILWGPFWCMCGFFCLGNRYDNFFRWNLAVTQPTQNSLQLLGSWSQWLGSHISTTTRRQWPSMWVQVHFGTMFMTRCNLLMSMWLVEELQELALEDLLSGEVCCLSMDWIWPHLISPFLIKGYGFTTNQYGLALDNVLEYELVTPDARIVNVTAQSDPELFSGLKVWLSPLKATYTNLMSHLQGTLNNFVRATLRVWLWCLNFW